MDQKQENGSRHIRSFWPLVIIFVVGALLSGLIIGATFSNQLQEEAFSFTFSARKGAGKKSQPLPQDQKVQLQTETLK